MSKDGVDPGLLPKRMIVKSWSWYSVHSFWRNWCQDIPLPFQCQAFVNGTNHNPFLLTSLVPLRFAPHVDQTTTTSRTKHDIMQRQENGNQSYSSPGKSISNTNLSRSSWYPKVSDLWRLQVPWKMKLTTSGPSRGDSSIELGFDPHIARYRGLHRDGEVSPYCVSNNKEGGYLN